MSEGNGTQRNRRIRDCIGSFKRSVECKTCPDLYTCKVLSGTLETEFSKNRGNFRETGKYKGRGKWKPKQVY